MSADFDLNIEDRLMHFMHQHFGHEVFTPGLERTEKYYAPLISKLKKNGVKYITIAGTNGKGQTAHTLAELFQAANYKIALWTSPHILSIKERFRFQSDVSYQELEQEMLDAEKEISGVSFYEFLFLVFLRLCLKQKSIDFIILEVGLGGRLDAVNHVDTDLAAITSISRDHQAILGTTLKEIWAEKIAVARSNRPLITSFSLQYLNELTHTYTEKNKIEWVSLPYLADYYQSNQKIAEYIFHYFLPEKGIERIEKNEPYKGRHEVMTFKGNSLIFVGAHNIDGMRKMVEHFSLKKNKEFLDVVLCSFSKRPTTEIQVMLKMLTDFSKNGTQVLSTFFHHIKACDRDVIEKNTTYFISDWKSELEKLSSTNRNKKILVCGSYYFIGEVQRFIINHS